MGSSVSKAWKKVTGSGGGSSSENGDSSSEEKATAASDSSVVAGAAEAEKAEVSEFGGVLSKGKKAKRGTELDGGNRTFGSDTLG